MAEPVIELIAVNIFETINSIKIAKGFNCDLTAVRPKMIDFSDVTPRDGTVLIYQEDEERPEREGTLTNEWNQTFNIVALVLQSDKSETPMDIKINRVRADIQKKLMEDDSRGGLALTTILGPSTIFNAGEGFAGISVIIIVNYRVSETDPYTRI